MEPEIEAHWNDGLRAALEKINRKRDFEVTFCNIFKQDITGDFDFILGWGGFNSPVDRVLKDFKTDVPKGLCIGGNAFPPRQDDTYDVLFYETNWYASQLEWHPNARRAFGINDNIFGKFECPGCGSNFLNDDELLYDYISVGSFSNWKRHEKIIQKPGNKLVIGQIQQDNPVESMKIIARLLAGEVAVSPMVDPEKLAIIYNLTKTVFVPADLIGGGERAVWEALSCGCRVEVEEDNPKLKSLLKEEPTNQEWYASALIAGIKSCLE